MSIDNFNTILRKEKVRELIPFLRGLDKDNKKEIASSLKSIAKEYLEFKQESSLMGSTSFKQKATKTQADMIYAAAFSCLGRKEYQKFDSFGQFLGNPVIQSILPSYCPEWYSDVVNDLTKRGWLPWHFNYELAMDLVDKGHLSPSYELISRLIPQMIFVQDQNHKYNYVPENLERRRITLEEHIWLIFQFETNINYSDRYHQIQNSKKDMRHWMEALRNCAAKGLVDRERLLRESLLATGRNFNKTLSGWFVDLFDFLEPTPSELLALQAQLMNTLSSRHSKAVNLALAGIKKIIQRREFNADIFLGNAPILLTSDTKSVVSKSISLLEKVILKDASLTEAVCVNVCQAFVHNDEEIQIKAAKLILKHYHAKTPSLDNEIGKYPDSMLMSAKALLSNFVAQTDQDQEEHFSRSSCDRDSTEALEPISTLDGLIFLASQAFDNNDPSHIDLLPAALVDLQDQLNGSTLDKFEPALQRAYTFIMSDWPATMGYLDHLLATFFIDVTKLLISRYPAEGSSLQKIHDSFKQKDSDNKAKWSWYNLRIHNLATWGVETQDNTYIIHKAILLTAYNKIATQSQLPLLSTPTHSFGFVDPLTLVERLARYQHNSQLPENYDFQLALSRIGLFNHSEALQETASKLKGEARRIVEFLLDPQARPTPPYDAPSLWFVAGVTKSPRETFPEFGDFFYSTLPKSTFTGDVPWRSFVEHYKIPRYNYQKKISEEVAAERNVLRLTLNPSPTIWQYQETKKENLTSRLTKLFTPSKNEARKHPHLLHELLSLKGRFLSAEHNDIQRFIYCFPSNPNPLLALVISKAMEHSTFASETDKRIVIKTLEAVVNLKFSFSEITYIFVATCMLTSDKTVRSFAGEMWLNGVVSSEIDSSQIGRILGIHLSAGYAPMKRLTDLVSSNLLKNSPSHNKALETMLTSLIQYIEIAPPVGTKRLLEIYSEVLLLNRSSPSSDKTEQKLNVWAKQPALKRIINVLMSTRKV